MRSMGTADSHIHKTNRLVPRLFEGVTTGVYMHPPVYRFKVTINHEGQGHPVLKIFKLGHHGKRFGI